MDETVLKEEETTEEDPLLNRIPITELMDQDPHEGAVAPGEKERIEEDEDKTIKEEPADFCSESFENRR